MDNTSVETSDRPSSIESSSGALVFSVVNQKGGVGKTTTAINLSASLSQLGHRVLLVDLDPQANATSGVGLSHDQIRYSMYHVLMDPDLRDEVLCPTPFDNLHVMPSSRDLAGVEVELVHAVSRETVLRDRLLKYRQYYDFVLIDCPPSLSLLTVNALVASDQAIIPLQCEYFALEGIAGLVQTLTQIRDHLNPRLEIGGIVLTMYDKRTSLNKQVVENAKRFFKHLVYDTVVPRTIRLTEAPSHGVPISLYMPSSRGALAYEVLAKEVMSRVYSR